MSTLKEIGEVYYEHKEARDRLGMTRDAFNHYVKTGFITPIKIIGTHRYFSKYEIDTIAKSLDVAVMLARSPLRFEKATLETQEEEFKLAALNFGEKTNQFNDKRRELLLKNPDMTYYVWDGKFLVASINIVPMSPEGITKFKDGERGWLMSEYVEPFAPGKSLECVIIDCMTTTLAPYPRRRQYAQRLFLGLADVFMKWLEQGTEIVSIHACGGTPDGRELLERVHFTYLGEPRTNRHIYELIIANSDVRLLDEYKRALSSIQESRGE